MLQFFDSPCGFPSPPCEVAQKNRCEIGLIFSAVLWNFLSGAAMENHMASGSHCFIAVLLVQNQGSNQHQGLPCVCWRRGCAQCVRVGTHFPFPDHQPFKTISGCTQMPPPPHLRGGGGWVGSWVFLGGDPRMTPKVGFLPLHMDGC